jgi:hypothetical protein
MRCTGNAWDELGRSLSILVRSDSRHRKSVALPLSRLQKDAIYLKSNFNDGGSVLSLRLGCDDGEGTRGTCRVSVGRVRYVP